MKTKIRLRMLFACAALFLWEGCISPSFAQQSECFHRVETGIEPGVWDAIKDYFATLDLSSSLRRSRSRLTQLRASIIDLESQKLRLIEIVEAHMEGGAAGIGISSDLRLSRIPDALTRIDAISQDLAQISREGDLFAAEDSFKALKINIDRKRVDTLCRLANEAGLATPDRSMMRSLVNDLKDEVRAISAAEDALGKHIKERNK
ncbi:hypothetical protein [Bradyrhizobium sp. Leo121]|uniref:hypothetical protein n=1 Tax=Bradyrhizobium sp. Leo121 TaxID=1571195 RepID=UPI001029716F|nr:hypothetical protein [Bradyrhizobium sp. Leo121]RZN33905.1 hypothetical protein CWO90_08725 [Bradyrhizobium sp. Leo121]